MSRLTVMPLKHLKVSRHQIPAHQHIPNTSVQRKPLLIYHSAFAPAGSDTTDLAAAIEAHLAAMGAVAPQWRYGMYATTHFHSTTHEVLCVSGGAARLCFGGDGNPGRVEESVRRGDVVVVPAGVGHRLLCEEEDGESFEMVGAYPPGCRWDMCYGRPEEEGKVKGIERLGWFERDPVYGDEGPVLEV